MNSLLVSSLLSSVVAKNPPKLGPTENLLLERGEIFSLGDTYH